MEGEKGLTPTNQPVVLELFCSWACRLFPPTREKNTGEKNISAKSAILLFFAFTKIFDFGFHYCFSFHCGFGCGFGLVIE